MNYGYPNYGYPPYFPQQYPPQYQNQMQQNQDKLRELEGRINWQNQSFGFSSTQPQVQTIIPVSSEDEAWAYSADPNGARQYFYDETNGAFYTKQFDANVPTTIKEIYRKVQAPIVAPESTESASGVNVSAAIERLETRFNSLENSIRELIENDRHDNAKNMAMDTAKVPGRADDNEQGDGSAGKPRASNGRFTRRSGE